MNKKITTNPSEEDLSLTSDKNLTRDYPFGFRTLIKDELPQSVFDYVNLHQVFEFVEELNFRSGVKWERTENGQSIHFLIDWDELDEWEQSKLDLEYLDMEVV